MYHINSRHLIDMDMKGYWIAQFLLENPWQWTKHLQLEQFVHFSAFLRDIDCAFSCTKCIKYYKKLNSGVNWPVARRKPESLPRLTEEGPFLTRVWQWIRSRPSAYVPAFSGKAESLCPTHSLGRSLFPVEAHFSAVYSIYTNEWIHHVTFCYHTNLKVKFKSFYAEFLRLLFRVDPLRHNNVLFKSSSIRNSSVLRRVSTCKIFIIRWLASSHSCTWLRDTPSTHARHAHSNQFFLHLLHPLDPDSNSFTWSRGHATP